MLCVNQFSVHLLVCLFVCLFVYLFVRLFEPDTVIGEGQNSKVEMLNVTLDVKGVNQWTLKNLFCVAVIDKLCEKLN